jgi:ADP-ribose pyrophosphatase YjhB (NUDIX family)
MLSEDRFKLILSVYIILVKDGKTLLLKRANTGYQDGNYGLVAGHVDGKEPATEAVCREVFEESGLKLDPAKVRLVHAMHRIESDERFDLFFTIDKWRGEPYNKEPDKSDSLDWFPIDDLPDNTIPYIRQVLECFQSGTTYSEYGWSR